MLDKKCVSDKFYNLYSNLLREAYQNDKAGNIKLANEKFMKINRLSYILNFLLLSDTYNSLNCQNLPLSLPCEIDENCSEVNVSKLIEDCYKTI